MTTFATAMKSHRLSLTLAKFKKSHSYKGLVPGNPAIIIIQVAELASLAHLLPPCSPTCVIRHRTALRQSCCCSPIALIRFNCCSPFASASAAARHLCLLQLLLPDCVRFNCSPIASASAVAPRLCPPQVQLLFWLHLQLPDCVRFGCCSPIASASTAAPRLHPLNACSLTCSGS